MIYNTAVKSYSYVRIFEFLFCAILIKFSMLSHSSSIIKGPGSHSSSSLRYSGASLSSIRRSEELAFHSFDCDAPGTSDSQSHPANKSDTLSVAGIGSPVEPLHGRIEQLESDIYDYLNSLTDRVNEIEQRLDEAVDELKAEQSRNQDHQRKTLSEVAKRILVFLRSLVRSQPLLPNRRPSQSRTRMCRDRPITSARE